MQTSIAQGINTAIQQVTGMQTVSLVTLLSGSTILIAATLRFALHWKETIKWMGIDQLQYTIYTNSYSSSASHLAHTRFDFQRHIRPHICTPQFLLEDCQ